MHHGHQRDFQSQIPFCLDDIPLEINVVNFFVLWICTVNHFFQELCARIMPLLFQAFSKF
jgi:hypothetical protein